MLQIHKDCISDKEQVIKRSDKEIDKATKAYQVELDMMQTSSGVGKDRAIIIISETGIDVGRFSDENYQNSWAGMSPCNKGTVGKKQQGQFMSINTCNAHWWNANGSFKKERCFLNRRYESRKARRGKNKALIAGGHKIITLWFRVSLNRTCYLVMRIKD